MACYYGSVNLVGRDRELQVLDAAWRRAQRGERTVVSVVGEPGIGKTRLLDELAARIAGSEGTLAWGRATEVGLTPAFWPWLQAMSALDSPAARAPRLAGGDAPLEPARRLQLFEAAAA